MSLHPPAAPPEHMLCRTEVDTPIGRVGLLFSAVGLRALLLPGEPEASQRRKGWDQAEDGRPPAWAQELGERLARHLGGEVDALRDVPVDLTGLTDFQREVLGAARDVPPGSTTTYGELAQRLGRPQAARAIGGAMARNPVPLVVPCHRVVGKDGGLRGFTAPGGTDLKARLLAIETGE